MIKFMVLRGHRSRGTALFLAVAVGVCSTRSIAEVTDVWSYWRFQLSKGLYGSLDENLHEFVPRNVFDQQRKLLLQAHTLQSMGQFAKSHTRFAEYANTFPLLEDYAHYRILQSLYQNRNPVKGLIAQSESFLLLYPRSAFIPSVKHMLLQGLFVEKECDRALEILSSYADEQKTLRSDQIKQDRWVEGQCLMKRGHKDKAMPILRELWVNTLDEGQLKEIEALVKQNGGVISSKDTFDRAKYLKGIARYDEAIALIRARIPKSECGPDCLILEASLLFSGKRYKEAVDAYQDLYLKIRQSRFLYLKCRALGRDGDQASAVSCYDDFDRQPGITPGLRTASFYYRAQLHMDSENWAEAEKFFLKVLQVTRSGAFVKRSLWTLGWLQLHQSKTEKAIPYFEQLEKQSFEQLEKGLGTYWLAKTYLKLNRTMEAIRLFDKIRRDSPLSYYGILAQNRVNELIHLATVDSLPPLEIPDRLQPQNMGDDDSDLDSEFTTLEERTLYMQLKELTSVGLVKDARIVLDKLVRDRKYPSATLAQLYLQGQDYYRAILLAYGKLGYDQTKYPRTQNEWYYWQILYPQTYSAWVEPLADKYNFSPSILWSIMRSESLFREAIVSTAGARGLLQIMPNTGIRLAEKLRLRNFNPDQLMIAQVNILLSSKYLHDLIYKMDGQMVFTIASYNAGPHKVTKWMEKFKTDELDEFIERIPYAETRGYVMKNIHFLAVYSFLYNPKESRFRVANGIHLTPNPLLNSESENWDYEIE